MKPITYGVAYKDHPTAQTRYFGPFVSQQVRDFFYAALPKPQEGGRAWRFTLQPFQAHEGFTVSQTIMRERKSVAA